MSVGKGGGEGGGINEWKWEASMAAIARSASGVWSVGVWCWCGRCDDDNCAENVIVGGVVAARRVVGMVVTGGGGAMW